MGRFSLKEEIRLTGALITSGLFVHGNDFCRDDMVLFIVVSSRLHEYMYVLPTVHVSIGLEGNLAEACDVDGLRLQ